MPGIQEAQPNIEHGQKALTPQEQATLQELQRRAAVVGEGIKPAEGMVNLGQESEAGASAARSSVEGGSIATAHGAESTNKSHAQAVISGLGEALGPKRAAELLENHDIMSQADQGGAAADLLEAVLNASQPTSPDTKK